MYGNTSFGDEGLDPETLTADQRRQLERDLSLVAQHTRKLLPAEFVVGSDLTEGSDGPEATVAVRPPVGPVVSAGYTPEEADATITEDERTDLAQGLAASAALQVKQALSGSTSPTAR
ncbi:DUF5811 family protein [Halosimplex aquaticum]|uniref:DUF5811 family protein n=1 Tax=Halosimplex aquaticum TaxID=3026162 RepID=A0ABD5Y4S9_9EURY|nr:DUF5811 family protein [Halosimplex aquaticum]